MKAEIIPKCTKKV
jgi:hypothetical protein